MKFYPLKSLSRSSRIAGRFGPDRSGAVAVVFAFTAPVLVLLTGVAIDYTNATAAKRKLQAATDAGVLAAATVNPAASPDYEGAQRSAVEAMIVSSFQSQTGLVPAVTTTISADGTITTNARAQVPTYFGAILEAANVEIGATAQAKRGSTSMEISLVLDTTGSMSGAKMTALKAAALNLTNTVFAIPNASSRIKMSIVPFAQYVNIGTSLKGAPWLSGTDDVTTSGVSTGTNYPNAQYLNPYPVTRVCYNDGAPYDCSYTAYRQVVPGVGVPYSRPWTYTATWRGCVGSRAYPLDLNDSVDSSAKVPGFLDTYCASPLTRLTNVAATVRTAINSMSVGGETYIPAGLLWGWRTLSPRPPFADGAAAATGVKKFMVMMTDGQNTLTPSYPRHNGGSPTIANNLAAATCQKIKEDGVTIYTVALTVTDPAIKTILRNCASSPANYYDATTTAELASAFTRIGSEIVAIRLTR